VDEGCEGRFSRAYDVRRHLKAVHTMDLDELEVKKLLSEGKD
jgi:hypothetical protein